MAWIHHGGVRAVTAHPRMAWIHHGGVRSVTAHPRMAWIYHGGVRSLTAHPRMAWIHHGGVRSVTAPSTHGVDPPRRRSFGDRLIHAWRGSTTAACVR
jgi:hypothetical protein